MDTSGSNGVRLTFNNVLDRDPAWSRLGDYIAWARFPGMIGEIWIMRTDGSVQTFLVRGERPQWSKVSDEILFVDPYAPSNSQIAIIASDGTGLRHLTP